MQDEEILDVFVSRVIHNVFSRFNIFLVMFQVSHHLFNVFVPAHTGLSASQSIKNTHGYMNLPSPNVQGEVSKPLFVSAWYDNFD